MCKKMLFKMDEWEYNKIQFIRGKVHNKYEFGISLILLKESFDIFNLKGREKWSELRVG